MHIIANQVNHVINTLNSKYNGKFITKKYGFANKKFKFLREFKGDFLNNMYKIRLDYAKIDDILLYLKIRKYIKNVIYVHDNYDKFKIFHNFLRYLLDNSFIDLFCIKYENFDDLYTHIIQYMQFNLNADFKEYLTKQSFKIQYEKNDFLQTLELTYNCMLLFSSDQFAKYCNNHNGIYINLRKSIDTIREMNMYQVIDNDIDKLIHFTEIATNKQLLSVVLTIIIYYCDTMMPLNTNIKSLYDKNILETLNKLIMLYKEYKIDIKFKCRYAFAYFNYHISDTYKLIDVYELLITERFKKMLTSDNIIIRHILGNTRKLFSMYNFDQQRISFNEDINKIVTYINIIEQKVNLIANTIESNKTVRKIFIDHIKHKLLHDDKKLYKNEELNKIIRKFKPAIKYEEYLELLDNILDFQNILTSCSNVSDHIMALIKISV